MGARAQSFRIGEGDTSIIFLILGVIVVAVLLWGLKYLYTNVYLVRKKEKQEWARFYQVCRRRKLTKSEVEFLTTVARKYRLQRPVYIVRFLETFDKLVYREIQTYRHKETKQREQFTIFVFNIRKKLGFANFDKLEELTSSRHIREGQVAQVSVQIANLDKSFEGLVAKVDEEGVVVKCPDFFLKEEPVREGQTVEFRVTHHNDAEYVFRSVVYKIMLGPPGYLFFDHTHSFTRIQKRKYPRLDIQIPFQYFRLTHMQKKEFMERRTVTVTSDVQFEEATMANLSAGGIAFVTEALFDVENLVGLAFSLRDDMPEFHDIVARVERITELDDGQKRVVLRYVKIQDRLRDLVNRFVFEQKSARPRKVKSAKSSKRKPASA